MNYADSPYWLSLQRLDAWLVAHNYQGYDPFDGLSSYLRPLTFHKRFPQQVLQQVVRRNPFNLRPLLGIKPHTSSKGMGFLAGGYLQLAQMTGDKKYYDRTQWAFDWLMTNKSPGYTGYCWGNAFDYISRGSDIPKDAPTVVWSGLIGHEFIDAWRALKDRRYLDVARDVARFIMTDLAHFPVPHGTCISYVTNAQLYVHNANLLGARMLSEVYKETGEQQLLDLATAAVRASAMSQLPNGAWYYGEDPMYHWIDNWHTAYDLDAILGYQLNSGNTEFQPVLEKGLQFFVDNFFTPDGGPKYYWDRAYKFDIQSSSQAIDTLTLFSREFHRPELLALAEKVAGWTIANMQDPSGYFYLWKNAYFTNRTPTMHWGAATMFHALAHLLRERTAREH
jgi:hypothetical protein